MGRVNNIIALCCLSFILCSVVCNSSSLDSTPKQWCVTRDGESPLLMETFKDAICKKQDCSAIQSGAPCFEPNTLENHTSYALSLYYRLSLTCPKYVGVITSVDPSHGKCQFP